LGTDARVLRAYELRCLDRAVGSRFFTSDEERQAFIGRSFTDVAIHELDPPERQQEPHSLTHLIGERLVAVTFEAVADCTELRWANGHLRIYAQACLQDATGQISYDTPGYQDRLAAVTGHELANVDEFLDQGLVLTFGPETKLVIPLDSEGTDGPEAAEYSSTDEWTSWYTGQPPFE
jgi:hypothetical protein